jgi:hypothetical protein
MAEEKDLAELVKEFVAALMTYLRQRGQEFITDLTLKPLRKIAPKLVLLAVALTLFILGAVYLGAFMVMGLSWLCGGNPIWGHLCAAVIVLAIGLGLLMLMGKDKPAKEVGQDGREKLGQRDDRHDQ